MMEYCPKCSSENQTILSHDETRHEEMHECRDCGYEYITPDIIIPEEKGYESGFEAYCR